MVNNLKKWEIISGIIFVLIIITISSIIYNFTGFFHPENIDDRDLNYWTYTESGTILNSEEFVLEGNKEICWLMIHSYGSTPMEMKNLANKVNEQLGDKIYSPRLEGHGEVPSKLLELKLTDWYEQIKKDYINLQRECKKINVVGSSFGAVLTLKLAEDYELNSIFLINPYLSSGPLKDRMLDLFSEHFVYLKKSRVANINDLEGLNNHIAYWNFALTPVKYSKQFIKDVESSLANINEDTLIIHSTKDQVSYLKPILEIEDKINSKNFEMIIFDDSNHILLADYEKEDTINGIVFNSPNHILLEKYDEENLIRGIIEYHKTLMSFTPH